MWRRDRTGADNECKSKASWNLTRRKKQEEEEVETMCVTIEAVIEAVVVVAVEQSPR